MDISLKNYDYIEQRLKPQMEYYQKSCRKHQKQYRFFTITNIVATAIIPIVSLSANDVGRLAQYLSAVLGAIASITSGIVIFEKLRDKRIHERYTYEKLKSELAKFSAKAGPYKSLNAEDSEIFFVDICESYMDTEHDKWRKAMSKKNDD